MTTETALNTRDRWLIFLALLIIVVAPFTADSYTPSMPAIAEALRISADQTQLTMTLYLLGAAVSQLIYGPMSDHYGRKPIILSGLMITILGSAVCAYADSLLLLLAGRLIQGCGAGVCNALFRAVLRDSFSGPKMSQAGSYASMFYTVAFAGAPIIGGYITSYFGWHANFVFTMFFIIVIAILLAIFLPETHIQTDKSLTQLHRVTHNYLDLVMSPVFVGYSLISSLAFSGLVSYYTSAPFILQRLVGLTPIQFGWISLALAVGMFVGQFANAKWVVKKSVGKMLLLGLILMCISGFSMLIFGLFGILNTTVVVVPTILFCIASGFVFSNAMADAFHPFGHIAGSAGAMYGFIQIIGSSLVSMIVSHLHEESQLPLAYVYCGLGFTALSLFFLLKKDKNSA